MVVQSRTIVKSKKDPDKMIRYKQCEDDDFTTDRPWAVQQEQQEYDSLSNDNNDASSDDDVDDDVTITVACTEECRANGKQI